MLVKYKTSDKELHLSKIFDIYRNSVSFLVLPGITKAYIELILPRFKNLST